MEINVPAAAHHGHPAIFGTQSYSWVANLEMRMRSHASFNGTISPPKLEALLGATALSADVKDDKHALGHVSAHLQRSGFTAAPNSQELVRLLREVPSEMLAMASQGFKNCVGLNRADLANEDVDCPSNVGFARIVLESLVQLDSILPQDAVVVGLIEGTYRNLRNAISWLHLDEIRNSSVYIKQSLFPLSDSNSLEELAHERWRHYSHIRSVIEKRFPGLKLPSPAQAEDNEGNMKTPGDLLACVADYNLKEGNAGDPLVFECLNVWIPKGEKHIALLTAENLRGAQFEDTRPSLKEVEVAGFQHKFQSFSKGVVSVFFGRHVLHQAAEGEAFPACPHGSMELRFLVLLPRSRVPRQQCLCMVARTAVVQQKFTEVNVDGILDQASWPF